MTHSEFEQLAEMIKSGFDEVHGRIDSLEEKVDAGFQSVHRRMDDLAEKVGNHEERLLVLEK